MLVNRRLPETNTALGFVTGGLSGISSALLFPDSLGQTIGACIALTLIALPLCIIAYNSGVPK